MITRDDRGRLSNLRRDVGCSHRGWQALLCRRRKQHRLFRPNAMRFTVEFVAGLEEYFFEVGQPLEGKLPPKPTKAEIDKLLEAAPRYGIEFILPAEDGG